MAASGDAPIAIPTYGIDVKTTIENAGSTIGEYFGYVMAVVLFIAILVGVVAWRMAAFG